MIGGLDDGDKIISSNRYTFLKGISEGGDRDNGPVESCSGGSAAEQRASALQHQHTGQTTARDKPDMVEQRLGGGRSERDCQRHWGRVVGQPPRQQRRLNARPDGHDDDSDGGHVERDTEPLGQTVVEVNGGGTGGDVVLLRCGTRQGHLRLRLRRRGYRARARRRERHCGGTLDTGQEIGHQHAHGVVNVEVGGGQAVHNVGTVVSQVAQVTHVLH